MIRARRQRASSLTPTAPHVDPQRVKVPRSVRRLDPAVAALRDEVQFPLTGELRRRTLLLAEAVVREARRRQWSVELEDVRGDQRAARRTGKLVLSRGPGRARVWFAQPRLRSETPAGRQSLGSGTPEGQYSAVERLVIRATHVRSYSVKEWGDTQRRTLEETLDTIFEWIDRSTARHQVELAEREAQRAELEARYAAERDQATARQAAAAKEAELLDQATRWRQARELREYLDAIRSRRLAVETDPAKVAELEAWLTLSDGVADRLDPMGPLT